MFGLSDRSLTYPEARSASDDRSAADKAVSAADNEFLKKLRVTNPSDDKRRIEHAKGDLLDDCYQWVLHHEAFQRWGDDDNGRLLWIRGDPGKGKTMLICGIINHLEQELTSDDTIAYFFCQATDSSTNTAQTVVRGLVYGLLRRHLSLTKKILEMYGDAGDNLYEDANSWTALCKMLETLLKEVGPQTTSLLIDGLDECRTGRSDLLKLVVRLSQSGVRILVSSRNWPDIEQGLSSFPEKLSVRLELNADAISAAVGSFIDQKVKNLARQKGFDQAIQTSIAEYMHLNANDTFLWVALVCHDLSDNMVRKWQIQKKLESFPSGLSELYERMAQDIIKSQDVELCQQVLGLMSLAYRPIRLMELLSLVEDPAMFPPDTDYLQEIVELCGSFLVVKDGTIYFVHQSSQDFVRDRFSSALLPHDMCTTHGIIARQAIKAMSGVLEEDIYKLSKPGIHINDIAVPHIDPLAPVKYACLHWADHVAEAVNGAGDDMLAMNRIHLELFQNGGSIEGFLMKHLIHWFECLSLLRAAHSGITALANLIRATDKEPSQVDLGKLVREALRFLRYFIDCIDGFPLQIYTAGLVFTPEKSPIKKLFRNKGPKWIAAVPTMRDDWDEGLQTITSGPNGWNLSLSPSGEKVACDTWRGEIRIWDSLTGKPLQTLGARGSPGRARFHNPPIVAISFSPNGNLLASGTMEGTLQIWDTVTGESQVLGDLRNPVKVLEFLSDDLRLRAGAQEGSELYTWENRGIKNVLGWCETKKEIQHFGYQTSRFHTHSPAAIALDGTLVAFQISNSVDWEGDRRDASDTLDFRVDIWNTVTGRLKRTVRGRSPVFSADVKQLAVVTDGWAPKVQLWHLDADETLPRVMDTLEGHPSTFTFSTDARHMAVGTREGYVTICDTETGQCNRQLKVHHGDVISLCFDKNDEWMASLGFFDDGLRIWDVAMISKRRHDVHTMQRLQAFSPDHKFVATTSKLAGYELINVWATSTGKLVNTLRGHASTVREVAFSSTGSQIRLVSASSDSQVRVWEVDTGQCINILEHEKSIISTAISVDGTWVASFSQNALRIWNTADDNELYRSVNMEEAVLLEDVALSPQGTKVALLTFVPRCVESHGAVGASGATESELVEGDDHTTVSDDALNDYIWYSRGDKVLKILSTETGATLKILRVGPALESSFVHGGGIVFSPSGGEIAVLFSPAASGESFKTFQLRNVQIWDLGTGRCERKSHADLPIVLPWTSGNPGQPDYSRGFVRYGRNNGSSGGLIFYASPENPVGYDSLGLRLNSLRTWILLEGERAMWVPHEYRSQNRDSLARVVVLCSESGHVVCLDLLEEYYSGAAKL